MNQYWIWFANLESVGPHSKQRLVKRFRDARAIYEARDADYREVGLNERERRALSKKSLREVEQILKICARENIQIMTFDDAAYPQLLKEIATPPYVLYIRGRFPAVDELFTFGIVGTRKADQSGMNIAHRLAGDLTRAGACIVSGMAEGIDGAANTGALDAGGTTIAVLGCGVDVCYPTFHERLMAQIIENGAVVSEYPPGTRPLPQHFPIRNRIISGLSRGILVVQAPQKSGAKITADFALQQNRDLYAVPGNIDSPLYQTSNRLIKECAKMVLQASDIIQDYKQLYPNLKLVSEANAPSAIDWSQFSNEEQQILKVIGFQELSTDEIIRETQLEAQVVLSSLTMLELQGVLTQTPGHRFRLTQGF